MKDANRVAVINTLPSAEPYVPDTNVGDMISRQAAIDAFVKRTGIEWDKLKILEPMLCVLENLPSAERYGRWEIADDMPRLDNTFSIRCSLCGQLMLAHPNDENSNFCCNCGAKMVEVEE